MIEFACNLKGAGILVTRPRHQADFLCGLIQDHQGVPLRFPALEINPPLDPGSLRAALEDVANYDILIFVSANAVKRGIEYVPGRRFPGMVMTAAIGQATARVLAEEGYPLAIVPEDDFDSEALLNTSELQVVEGKRILIFRGENGRPLLGDVLKERGAKVDYAEVYRRCCPEPNGGVARQPWVSDIDLVTATSGEILDNLVTLFGDSAEKRLLQSPLVVVSERMREHARALGFRQILLADGPSDNSILETICRWVANR